MRLSFIISKPADELKVRIYTTAFRRIMDFDAGSSGSRETVVIIPQWKLGRLAAGTYYAVVSGRSVDRERASSKPALFIILKK
jgi:hypothetical protein